MEKLEDKPFVLLAANTITPDPKKLKEVMVKEQMPWRSIARRDAINEQWNNPATPSYYVLDHTGVIRHKWVGNPGAEAIDAALEKLIAEVPTSAKKPIK